MPDLRPFRGLRYDPARVTDLSAVLCPPYDVISPDDREQLLERDPVNAVRLELVAPTTASATDADFDRAAATLHSWLADGTLTRDERPMVYVYEQLYTDGDGTSRVARSFFCELRAEDYGPGSGILPHERTMAGPREYRFRLLEAVRTHISPVLFTYDDPSGGAAAALDELVSGEPDLDAAGPAGVGQRLWAIDPATSSAARQLLERAAAGPLTIADGHHRYETFLRYRDAHPEAGGSFHVLALLYESRSGGLGLAPWHRIISDVKDPASALDAAEEIFDSQRVISADELVGRLGESGQAGVLGLWTRDGGSVLRVDRERARPFVASVASEEVRWLDVSVLSGTLAQMIGASEAGLTAEGRLTYTHDAREALRLVDQGHADVCFLLRPTPIDEVLAVAAAGDFMPPKSTYFYPKAATGLVFDPLS